MNSITIDNVYIRWLGHAGFFLGWQDIKIYIDPFQINKEPSFDNKADILLITHEHFDHCSPEDIQKVRRSDSTTLSLKAVLWNSGVIQGELWREISLRKGLKLKGSGLRYFLLITLINLTIHEVLE